MISIFSAYLIGIKETFRIKKLVFLLFLIQFFFAYFLTKPFSALLTKTFSNSPFAEEILTRFNYVYFNIMFSEIGKGVSLFGQLIPILILYILITIFCTAGVYWLFFTKSEFGWTDFFKNCINYFTKFLKLYTASFLFYASCFIVLLLLLRIKSSLTANAISEVGPIILTLINISIFAILISLVIMLFDYAKVILISENYTSLFSAIREAYKFFIMNFIKTIGIYLLYVLTGITLFVIFKIAAGFFETDTLVKISLFIILSQVFVFIRQYLRLALFDSVIVYYQSTLTAMPGMLNKEMLEMAVLNYEKRAGEKSE